MEQDNVETTDTRKVHPLLAFLAGFFGLGMGYAYVGKLRFGVATIGGIYVAVFFVAWTRLIVQSALIVWLLAALMLLVALFALVHPIVLAAKNRGAPRKQYNRWWVYLLWSLGTLVMGPIGFFSRATGLGYETFSIPSSSMSPTVEAGDFVLSDTWRFSKHSPAVGDIVIVERPEQPGVKYIKRVVAVAGDSIAIRDGVLYRNLQAIIEPYVHSPTSYGHSPRHVPTSVVGTGCIYVLGDYRDNSLDSRQWGPLLVTSVRGRVQFIWFSMKDGKIRWDRIGTWLAPKD